MNRSIAVAAAATLLHGAVASAQVEDMPNVTFNGYGTLGLVHSDEQQADFASNLFVPDGAGHTRSWSPEVDSRFALQATAELTPRLSGIVQVIAEQRYDDTYTPTVEWANLAYELTSSLNVRAGRMVLPTFLTAEYRKVGYAHAWVRPPPEVYNLAPVSNTDGVAISHRSRINGFTNTLQVVYGRNDVKLVGGGGEISELKARNGVTVADTLEWGATTLFASYNQSHLTIESLNPFFDAFREFGPRGQAIADRYDVDDKEFEFVSLGARHDPGDWFVMGEWAQFDSRTFIGDSRAWYIGGGLRFGSLTPYATVARARVTSNTSEPGLSLAGLPPPLAAQAGELNSALNLLLNSSARQKSLSLGVRWDFANSTALKLQWDHLDLDEGSAGVLINRQPGFEPGGSVNLFSIAVDFVF